MRVQYHTHSSVKDPVIQTRACVFLPASKALFKSIEFRAQPPVESNALCMVPCPGACLSLVFRFQLSSEGFSGQSNCRKHPAHIILYIYICLYAFPRTVSIPNDLMQLRSEDARSDSKNPTAQCAMQCSYIEPRLRQISRGRMSPQREQAWHA